MKITSKFLTADVQLTRLTLRNGKIEMSGMVKGFMPIEIEASAADLRLVLSLAKREFPALRAHAVSFLKDRVPFLRGT